jgi:Zn finger protein HypA/HybF involved in hydrogenase expression
MATLSRKLRRKKENAAKKELQKKVGLFSKLEDHCLVCQKDFDKKNKEMVMSWSVVVKEDKVRLYCPDCWSRATQLIDEIKDGYENSKTNV